MLRRMSVPLVTCFVIACGGASDGGDPSAEGEEMGAGTAEGVVGDALEAWAENAEGVSGYTVTVEEDGRQRTERYVRDSVDGMPVFVPEGSTTPENTMVQVPRLLRAARHEGSGEVEGESTDVLVLDDPAALASAIGTTGTSNFRPVRLEMHVGKSDRMPRRFRMVGEAMLPGGETRETTTTVTMTDWRTVDGFAYPHRTVARTEGLEDMIGAAMEGMDAAMVEMERQIEQLPESQRETAREAMRGRMGMMADEDPLHSETVVLDLQVERGL
ncbi:MAG TPA: hypothetical protein VM778_13015 [Gemmatimonadota bacterium]|nr:hypothetical protein [Gemmatimonadota bacterium]